MRAAPADLRVFIGLLEIAGYYRQLERGFLELGISCTFVDLSGNPFVYGGHRPPRGIRFMEALARRKAAAAGWRRAVLAVVLTALKAPLLAWALVRFDVFIFGYRSTFFAYRELALLRRLGKKVVHCFHGSDVRPPYLNGAVMTPDGGPSIDECVALTRRTKVALRAIERHADLIISHLPYAHLQERPFVGYLCVGVPYSNMTGAVLPHDVDPSRARPVRALHSPSLPAAKGTEEIRRIVDTLLAAGQELELVEITGRPNVDVVEALGACDLVIDQLYSDTPMATFATEAAHAGRPVVVGGYEATRILSELADEDRPPSLFCEPGAVEEAIARLVDDEELRVELGQRARRFVTQRWTPVEVAGRYLRLLTGRIPEDWVRDPADCGFVHGVGLPEERARRLVADVVRAAGSGALMVDDKPELRAALLAFADHADDR